MVRTLKVVASLCHRLVAAGPPFLFHFYIAVLGSFSRQLPAAIGIRIRNNVAASGATWPDINLKPRRVTLGQRTNVLLHPHLGEYDEEALFVKQLTYEAHQFRWLEMRAGDSYDMVIEIGANVGLYSVFFDRLSRSEGSRLKRVISFEPSREAYRRLISNLTANHTRNVTPFAAAIGVETGFQVLYQPKGHLANGSFDREFVQLISTDITAVPVLTVGADELKFFFRPDEKVLVKIDAEGFEAKILKAFRAVATTYKPDIIVEVLPQTQIGLEACAKDIGFQRYLLADNGPVHRQTIEASPIWRDWILRPK